MNVRHRPFLLAALAIFAAGSSQAQNPVSVAITAETEMRAAVNSEAVTLAAGSDLSQGMSLSIERNVGIGLMNASASVARQSTSTEVGVAFASASGAFLLGSGSNLSRAGQHTIAARFRADQPTAGHLSIKIGGSISRFASSPSARVEIVGGPDVVGERSGIYGFGGELELPAVIDADGLTVRATLLAETLNPASGNSVSNQVIAEIKFITLPGRIEPYGAPCGPTLTAYYKVGPVSPPKLGFTVSGSPVSPHSFVALGLQELNLPIPGIWCPLRTDIVIPKSVTIDQNGNGTLSLPLPRGFTATFLAQHLVATPNQWGYFDWHTSEGLRIRL